MEAAWGKSAVSARPPIKARRLQIRMDGSVPDNTRGYAISHVLSVCSHFLHNFQCAEVAHGSWRSASR
jgi:hypothetical protein